jgi:hypothetical protein
MGVTNLDLIFYGLRRLPTCKPHYIFSSGGWWRIAFDGAPIRPLIGNPWDKGGPHFLCN